MTRHAVYLGLDMGAENIKAVLVEERDGALQRVRSEMAEHRGDLRAALRRLLDAVDLAALAGAAATGRRAGIVTLPLVPAPRALAEGFAFARPGHGPATLVNIGSRGYAVLEIRSADDHVYRENGRCSQGTGNFLRQLTGRFGLEAAEADRLCAGVPDPSPLSGRCPVILKTDMTHLANGGTPRERVLAGLFDAVAENVEVLIKPGKTPRDVFLCGGVAESRRVREHVRRFLDGRGLALRECGPEEHRFYEATGAALEARRLGLRPPAADGIFSRETERRFDRIPALRAHMQNVTRHASVSPAAAEGPRDVALGFDIGSTGAKAAAVDAGRRQTVWRRYVETRGDPVGAARALAAAFVEAGGPWRVKTLGVTGSGREIVGCTMRSCYGRDRVTVLNEIAAHAAGALHFDPAVDTIFEIGGQDAKYIRLADGEVCDSAMNEACSAGTGSFIEEQGRRLGGIAGVSDLADRALAAQYGVSLGQHCSVFMAEVIEEALSRGEPLEAVVAGIFDSVVRNYLNRVKGARSVGSRIFCQGMPFTSPALAAAVAGQTGRHIVVPPDPGFMGALGIGLLALKHAGAGGPDLDPAVFCGAKVVGRDTFVCPSSRGCGGAGNRCRVDRVRVQAAGRTREYLWGGGCSLYDRGTGVKPLPDLAPDPARRRAELLAGIAAEVGVPRGRPRVGMTDEFVLKDLFPFFGSFIRELGFDPMVRGSAGRDLLKLGIEEASVPLCAPMQLYAGILSRLAEAAPEHLFLPMIRDVPRAGDEPVSTVCPLSQASQDMYVRALARRGRVRVHRPVIDMGPGNLESALFRASLRRMAAGFGVRSRRAVDDAFDAALQAQRRFEAGLAESGREALEFAARHDIVPVVVLGRTYTVCNDVLNSSVPRLLRELGAIAIPVDCYPLDPGAPVYPRVYWGCSQANLRAAWQVSRTPGHYAVFCTNYSCGPDSFTLHFVAHRMRGKPFAVIETDGHSGDAGTKTRLEAFLYCVGSDRRAGRAARPRPGCGADPLRGEGTTFSEVRRRGDTLLIPRMGENAGLLAACLGADGYRCEALPMPDAEALALGRRHTSGKECLPAAVTFGSLLQRVRCAGPAERFALFMPTASGPCRFGMYHLLHRLLLGETGYDGRVSILSQHCDDYFDGISPGLGVKVFAAFVAGDLLLEALLDARPAEREPGAAQRVYDRWRERLVGLLAAGPAPAGGAIVANALNGVFGIRDVLRGAAKEFAAVRDRGREIPAVALVGEIYVRLDPFSNDFVIHKLEQRGLRVRLAPFREWMEYVAMSNRAEARRGRLRGRRNPLAGAIPAVLGSAIRRRLHAAAAGPLGWPKPALAADSVRAASELLREELLGEAVLTLGFALHEFHRGVVHGAVSVGPLECMPNRIAEAQFQEARERFGLPTVTLSLNGDPMDTAPLDSFAYDVRRRFAAGRQRTAAGRS